jgi:DNA (cytosine-5)-methyltransferase 3A
LNEYPKPKEIKLIDIIDNEFSADYIKSLGWQKWFQEKKKFLVNKKYVSINPEKGQTMTARQYANWNGNFMFIDRKVLVKEATKRGFVEVFENEFVDLTFINSKTRRGRKMDEKSNCLTASNFDYCQFKIDDNSNGFFRRLTPIECERLQTVPDNYTNFVSDKERYKMLGNGWTVDVICYLLENVKK